MYLYPKDVVVTIDDFRQSAYLEIIQENNDNSYMQLWQSLSSAVRIATQEGSKAKAKVLWLLADICSMRLNSISTNEPYKPNVVNPVDNSRSALPEDILSDDILLLAEFLKEVDHDLLKARIADLLWLKKSPKEINYSIIAIDSYVNILLDIDTWLLGGRECWERAIVLAMQINNQEKKQIIEEKLLTAFSKESSESGFLAMWISELLLNKGLAKLKSVHIAQQLERIAKKFESQGDVHRYREYMIVAQKWFKVCSNIEKILDIYVLLAESYVLEATAVTVSNAIRASLYEKAIQTYRQIPTKQREKYNVEERIKDLYKKLNNAGLLSVDEMKTVSTEPIDIVELVNSARENIAGKNVLEALMSFANIYKGIKVERIRKAAKEYLNQFLFQRLFASTHISSDGRVIAKIPALGFDENKNDSNTKLWSVMISEYKTLVHLIVISQVLPAHDVMLREHRLVERDFISLACNSPIVPVDRVDIWGKALFMGYEKNFVTALHLLVPQIENMVRYHLKQHGARTTNLDKDGIENECGLSTLLSNENKEIATKIFGEDIYFELKALFCDSLGANLRNELAHGLLNGYQCSGVDSIYAWWFALSLTSNAFWVERNLKVIETESV